MWLQFKINQRNLPFDQRRIYGALDFTKRAYVVRDPDVYKRIAIKDFDHFQDHRSFFDGSVDEISSNVLIALKADKWRQMRATLSPAFTGSKMRQMFELISECADEIVEHFTKKAESGEKLDVEMKDFFSRYTNDVIATCAFGIKVNSFADPDNEFFVNGKKVMKPPSPLKILQFFIIMWTPKIARLLKLKGFDESVTMSFKRSILETMKMRKENNIYRPDMVQLLMQVREGNLDHQADEKSKDAPDGFATAEESEVGKTKVTRTWTDSEIIAQCLLFFFAGFETSSTMLTFVAYELVANPDVQQKLYEEIAAVNEQLDGKRITYDVIQKMKYLDQVISETLRMWPAALQVDRECVKDYTYDDGHRKFTIEKGSVIAFSLLGIQRDPKYFPNPDVFDPSRFDDENKHKIQPGTYLPFGIGPRNCIGRQHSLSFRVRFENLTCHYVFSGSRFALMELKAIVYYLLLNFSLEPNKETQIPLQMKKGMMFATEKGVHLELRPRSQN